MRLKKILFVSVFVLTLLGVIVQLGILAQGRPQGDQSQNQEFQQGQRPPHPPHPVMQALDKDRDGELSPDEIEGAPAALLTLDKNGDGKLGRDELRPSRPGQGGPRQGSRQSRNRNFNETRR